MSVRKILADLSIPLRFNGPQPNAYGVEPASAKLLGDTRTGSSVNFENVTFVPHCSGTHTECVGHITDERISIRDCLQDVLIRANLVSLEPELVDGDYLLTGSLLDRGLTTVQATDTALIVRTLPNDVSKLSRMYDDENIPPYFTEDAMRLIVERGIKHLLVDVPSIDRLFDEGKLTNHRIFWNVEPGIREVNPESRINSTITELIYVPNEVADGEYTLNLQIAPFASDAAPSRPILLDRML